MPRSITTLEQKRLRLVGAMWYYVLILSFGPFSSSFFFLLFSNPDPVSVDAKDSEGGPVRCVRKLAATDKPSPCVLSPTLPFLPQSLECSFLNAQRTGQLHPAAGGQVSHVLDEPLVEVDRRRQDPHGLKRDEREVLLGRPLPLFSSFDPNLSAKIRIFLHGPLAALSRPP